MLKQTRDQRALRQTLDRQVALTVVVTGFGGYSPHEHNPTDDAVGLLAHWHNEQDGVEADVVAYAREGRASYVDLTGLQPDDTVEIAGRACLVECKPALKASIVIDVASVRILTRAPQPWQRGTAA